VVCLVVQFERNFEESSCVFRGTGFVKGMAAVEVLVSSKLQALWVLQFFSYFTTEIERGEVVWWRRFRGETRSDDIEDVEDQGSCWTHDFRDESLIVSRVRCAEYGIEIRENQDCAEYTAGKILSRILKEFIMIEDILRTCEQSSS